MKRGARLVYGVVGGLSLVLVCASVSQQPDSADPWEPMARGALPPTPHRPPAPTGEERATRAEPGATRAVPAGPTPREEATCDASACAALLAIAGFDLPAQPSAWPGADAPRQVGEAPELMPATPVNTNTGGAPSAMARARGAQPTAAPDRTPAAMLPTEPVPPGGRDGLDLAPIVTALLAAQPASPAPGVPDVSRDPPVADQPGAGAPPAALPLPAQATTPPASADPPPASTTAPKATAPLEQAGQQPGKRGNRGAAAPSTADPMHAASGPSPRDGKSPSDEGAAPDALPAARPTTLSPAISPAFSPSLQPAHQPALSPRAQPLSTPAAAPPGAVRADPVPVPVPALPAPVPWPADSQPAPAVPAPWPAHQLPAHHPPAQGQPSGPTPETLPWPAAAWPGAGGSPAEPFPATAAPWLPLMDDPAPALDRVAQGLPGPGETSPFPLATAPLELASGPAALALAAEVAEPTNMLLVGLALLAMAAAARGRQR